MAAVADYAPIEARAVKLKKSEQPLTLTLEPTVDILATVAARAKPPYCVGFAAETNEVNANAEAKRRRVTVLLVTGKGLESQGKLLESVMSA